jgi:glycosyltransferase involved in cell wall biosynthesis
VKLLIIGDEISKLPALRRTVHRYKLHKHVRFFGFVPDSTLAILYRLARVFVFPSLYEGFGLPPLEAMASGTPVITSNVSSLPEVVGDAAPSSTSEPQLPRMRRVLTDAALRDDLRARGLAQAVLVGSICHAGDLRRGPDTSGAAAAPPPAARGARPRLADGYAGRREGARGHLRSLP